MKREAGCCLLVVALLALCLPALAHHGDAAYDEKNPVTLKGTVTDVVWGNPHVLIYFDARNSKGKVVHWGCQTTSPAKLIRSGWSPSTVKDGDHITATLAPAKNGNAIGYLLRILLPSGREVNLQELPQ